MKLLYFLFSFLLPLTKTFALTVNTDGTIDPGNYSSCNGTLCNPLGGISNINQFIETALEIILTIGVPVIAFFIIWAGFNFVTANGNEAKLKTAKAQLYGAVIGAAFILGAWVIATAIGATANELVNSI